MATCATVLYYLDVVSIAVFNIIILVIRDVSLVRYVILGISVAKIDFIVFLA